MFELLNLQLMQIILYCMMINGHDSAHLFQKDLYFQFALLHVSIKRIVKRNVSRQWVLLTAPAALLVNTRRACRALDCGQFQSY